MFYAGSQQQSLRHRKTHMTTNGFGKLIAMHTTRPAPFSREHRAVQWPIFLDIISMVEFILLPGVG